MPSWTRSGRRVDLHLLTFDEEGNGLQELQDGSLGTYTAAGLTGSGMVAGRSIKCLSPGLQVRFHTGYEPDADDRHDVRLLCERFDIEPPKEYRPTGTGS